MSKTDQDAREHLLNMRAMVRQLELQGLKDHSMYGYLIVMFVRYEGICWQMLNEFFFSFLFPTPNYKFWHLGWVYLISHSHIMKIRCVNC